MISKQKSSTYKNASHGFALLMSILTAAVTLSIGLAILNVTTKQLVLSNVSAESEVGFHAAYSGVECAQFWNVANVFDVGAGDTTINCMGLSVAMTEVVTGLENAQEVKNLEFDWSLSPIGMEACTNFTVYKYFDSSNDVSMDVLSDKPTVPSCIAGTECTVVRSRGYNRSCSELTSVRTVEREVITRF